jgi:hypothetical protein
MRFFPQSDTGWELIYTPSMVKAKIEQVSSQVLSFNKDVRSYLAELKKKYNEAKDPKERTAREERLEKVYRFGVVWSSFIESFNQWYGSNPSSLFGSNYSQAEDYQRQLVQFWDKFVQLGGEPTMDKPNPPPADTLARYMPLLYLGVGVAGLWALSKIIGSVASTGAFDKEKRE